MWHFLEKWPNPANGLIKLAIPGFFKIHMENGITWIYFSETNYVGKLCIAFSWYAFSTYTSLENAGKIQKSPALWMNQMCKQTWKWSRNESETDADSSVFFVFRPGECYWALLCLNFFLFGKKKKIHWFERQNYRQRGNDRERSPSCWFPPQMATMMEVGPGHSARSSMWAQGSRHIGSELV